MACMSTRQALAASKGCVGCHEGTAWRFKCCQSKVLEIAKLCILQAPDVLECLPSHCVAQPSGHMAHD